MLAQDDTSARQPEKVDDGPIIYVAYQRGNHFEGAMQYIHDVIKCILHHIASSVT